MIPGISEPVLIAVIAVTGVLAGAVSAFVGHLLQARTARANRAWTAVWPKKAEAYEELLRWSKRQSKKDGH